MKATIVREPYKTKGTVTLTLHLHEDVVVTYRKSTLRISSNHPDVDKMDVNTQVDFHILNSRIWIE